MAHRREDVSLLEMLQQHDSRIRRLEGPDKGVRQNDIRLGNQLIKEGPGDNTLVVRDLRNDSEFTLPGGSGMNEATFSWGGWVELHTTDTAFNHSPKYYFDRNVVLNKLVWTNGGRDGDPDTLTYSIRLNWYLANAPGGYLQGSQLISRTESGFTLTHPYLVDLNIPLVAGSELSVELVQDGDDDHHLYNMAITVKWN